MKSASTRVLLVEDGPDWVGLLEKRLTAATIPFEVESVGSLAAGIEKLRQNPFDAVVLDLNLPDSRGSDTVARMHDAVPELPIVVMSSLDDDGTIYSALHSGAQEYVHKDLSALDLLDRTIIYAIGRKQVDLDLKRGNDRWRALFEHSPVETIVVDRDGRITDFNAAKRTSGDRLPAFGDRMYVDYAGQHETDVRLALMECIETGVIREIPERNYGDKVLSIRIAPFPVENPLGAVITSQDITEHKKMEEQLRQSEKMDAIGQLAGGVAHDFNNQLCGIMNYADLLLSKTEDEELHRHIEAIIRLCTRGKDLTGQLLAFARGGKYQTVSVNIHRTIAEVISILEHSIDKRIAIRQLFEANPATTTGDPTQLQNALLNLSLNSRDAMPEGGELVFTTRTVTLDEAHCSKSTFDIAPGDYLEVTVADSGTGMAAATRAKVFEPFFTTKEQGKGTGMGLASVYGTVINHRGAIEVDTQVGKGTRMTVYLPLLQQEARKDAATVHAATARSGGAGILLVDDEKSVRESTAELLRGRGYKVVTARDGVEAVEYYGKSWEHIDLVIVDMNMPVMDGRDTFNAMRKTNPDVKAVLATGYSLDERAQEVLDGGALSRIQKPFRIHDLVQQVEQALGL